jgi:oxalate---CoA ligase
MIRLEMSGEAEINSGLPDRIIELLRRTVGIDPTAPALIAETQNVLSYGELLDQVERIVRVLVAAGVGSNDRVAIVGTSSVEMVALFLAIAATASCAPLNPLYTASEFEFYLKDLTPRLLIAEVGLPCSAREVARELEIPVLEFRTGGRSGVPFDFLGAPDEADRPEFATADDAALVLHTSGTTARPKMVPLTQRNLCISALNIARSLELSPTDRCLNVMPLFHIHGLIGAALSTIASGGAVVCAGIFRAPAFFGWLSTFRPTWYTAVPSMHAAALARTGDLAAISLSHRLRFIRSCSAPLPPALITKLEELFGVPVIEAYGMTEASHQMTCNPLPPGLRKLGSVGIPTGTSTAIMDETGALLPPGAEGEIVVRGANVMAGYAATEEVNARAFTEGWFHTGDQGRLDEDGYLFITGRIKEIINRGGEKISPREIDELFLAHPAVAEATTFALPDARLGEDIGVAIVLAPQAEEVDAKTLLHFAETRLAPFKLPRRIVFVSEIPKGPTGKSQRIGLAKRLGLGGEAEPAKVSVPMGVHRSAAEKTLMRLCSEAFQLKTIGINDDFFDSGGDSLGALTFLLEIERHFNIEITIADLLAGPTIAQLARVIDEAAPTRQPPQLAVIQPGGMRPPFFCLGAGPRYRELARRLGDEQPFLGPVLPHASKLVQPCRIEDVAAHHVEIIRAAQSHGPYFIGGWCIDGLVAYEVAQQLRALGEPVGLLVLFDTSFYSSWFSAAHEQACAALKRGSGHLRWILGLSWSELFRKVRGQFSQMVASMDYPVTSGQGEPTIAGGWMETAVQRRAASKYRPRYYDGRVLVLRRSLHQSRRTRARQDWSRLVQGRIDAYDIPGDHEDMFEKPHVIVTAEKLRASLRNAQAVASSVQ